MPCPAGRYGGVLPRACQGLEPWLQGEVDRRYDVADADADIEGEVHANVGPRIFVVVEELNTTQALLRRRRQNELWELGMPRRSLASEAPVPAIPATPAAELISLREAIDVGILERTLKSGPPPPHP